MDRAGRWHTATPTWLQSHRQGHQINPTSSTLGLFDDRILYPCSPGGILGDTSAHAFTEMGLGGSPHFFTFIFGLGCSNLLYRYKIITPRQRRGRIFREFWMYGLSGLVFFCGAHQCIELIACTNTIVRTLDASQHRKGDQRPYSALQQITNSGSLSLLVSFPRIQYGFSTKRVPQKPDKRFGCWIVPLCFGGCNIYRAWLVLVPLQEWHYVLMACCVVSIISNAHYLWHGHKNTKAHTADGSF